MEILLVDVNVEDVEIYEGKNGFGCNVKVSKLIEKKRKMMEFAIKNVTMAKLLEEKLQEEVTIRMVLDQNKFGLRLGEVLEIA